MAATWSRETSMPAEIQRDFADSVHNFGRLVHQTADDQWANETPCSDWDVRALVNHLVNEALWVKPLLDGMTIAEVGDRFDGDVLGDDPAAAFDRAAAEAVAAAGEPGVTERTVHISSGESAAAEYLSQVFADFVVHGWDLARGIGADDTIDPAHAASIYEEMKPMEDEMRTWGVYGGRIEVADGADAQTRLLALFGRVQER
jgi:uncharacterized protein (TIGR03086 family)